MYLSAQPQAKLAALHRRLGPAPEWLGQYQVLQSIANVGTKPKARMSVDVVLNIVLLRLRGRLVVLDPVLQVVAVLEKGVDVINVVVRRCRRMLRAVVNRLEAGVVTPHTLPLLSGVFHSPFPQ